MSISVDEAAALLDGNANAAQQAIDGEAALQSRLDDALARLAVVEAQREALVQTLHTERERFREEERRLKGEAYQDPLTALPNRRAFDDRMATELRRARGESFVTLVLVDLDRFKAINDVGGHAAGDRVLAAVGGALDDVTKRTTEFAARIGGEEFAVVLAGGIEEGRARAEALRERLATLAIPRPDGGVVTASMGVASLVASQMDRDLLFDLADQALYAAKNQGRDRVVTIEDLSAETVDLMDDGFGPTDEELNEDVDPDLIVEAAAAAVAVSAETALEPRHHTVDADVHADLLAHSPAEAVAALSSEVHAPQLAHAPRIPIADPITSAQERGSEVARVPGDVARVPGTQGLEKVARSADATSAMERSVAPRRVRL